MCEKERERVSVCVCVCVRERERETVIAKIQISKCLIAFKR